MTNRPASLCLTVLLLVASVHQLGASPCGCLEHNGWYQALVHDQGHCDHERDADGHAELCDCECDHVPPLVAMIQGRVPTDLRCNCLACSFPDVVVAPTGLANLDAKRIRECRPGTLSGGTLRAQLQVFCL